MDLKKALQYEGNHLILTLHNQSHVKLFQGLFEIPPPRFLCLNTMKIRNSILTALFLAGNVSGFTKGPDRLP